MCVKNQGGSQRARDGRSRSQDFIPEAEGVHCKQLFWEEWMKVIHLVTGVLPHLFSVPI